ncbi:hypothetical protein DFJ58DRAFT_882257 [Suillus subalutaceus]|uniref:uncharacterized protein n=1 Tax=Suillus subalutaceus TaxID=48586 RepID=UPI001B8663EB|nr:uncharacterized protein DFJ58DRAFT_882257 [Suillus subalutaceus]KAG1854784.1 hypothetical protein DFJ58DRAFT_882257 [Suillus subalutaceus]
MNGILQESHTCLQLKALMKKSHDDICQSQLSFYTTWVSRGSVVEIETLGCKSGLGLDKRSRGDSPSLMLLPRAPHKTSKLKNSLYLSAPLFSALFSACDATHVAPVPPRSALWKAKTSFLTNIGCIPLAQPPPRSLRILVQPTSSRLQRFTLKAKLLQQPPHASDTVGTIKYWRSDLRISYYKTRRHNIRICRSYGLSYKLLMFFVQRRRGESSAHPSTTTDYILLLYQILCSHVQAASVLSPPAGSATTLGLHAFPSREFQHTVNLITWIPCPHLQAAGVLSPPAGNRNRGEALACFDLLFSSIVNSQLQIDGYKGAGGFSAVSSTDFGYPLT